MTTHVIADRLTAEEAYRFFRDTTANLPDDTAKAGVVLKVGFEAMVDSDVYWSKLPPQLQAVWGRYRTPSLPWWSLLFSQAIQYDLVWKAVVFLRRIMRI